MAELSSIFVIQDLRRQVLDSGVRRVEQGVEVVLAGSGVKLPDFGRRSNREWATPLSPGPKKVRLPAERGLQISRASAETRYRRSSDTQPRQQASLDPGSRPNLQASRCMSRRRPPPRINALIRTDVAVASPVDGAHGLIAAQPPTRTAGPPGIARSRREAGSRSARPWATVAVRSCDWDASRVRRGARYQKTRGLVYLRILKITARRVARPTARAARPRPAGPGAAVAHSP